MSEVRCFMRYNNQGKPYRICNDKDSATKTNVKPAVFTPLISVDEFLKKRKKTYAQLTPGQKRAYHRIDMANRRKEERKLMEMNKKELEKFKNEIRAERKKEREAKEKAKAEKQKEKEDKAKAKALKDKKSFAKEKKKKAQQITAKATKGKVKISFD